MPHLFSGIIASGLAAAILFATAMVAAHVEDTTLPSTASELFPLKNQGLAFQRAAARAGDVLPLYGSSELVLPVPEKATNFFRTAPTGFRVSPVGSGGTSSLIILQKVGALGSDFRGKKIAISLSPSWFFTQATRWNAYEGNFSVLAASELAFGTVLDFKLKRDIALRMLQCPSTVQKRPLLEFALRRLASGRWIDRVLFCALWPIGKMQTTLLELQDHFAALIHIKRELKPAPPNHSEIVDWPKLIAEMNDVTTSGGDNPKQSSSSDKQTISNREVAFRNDMNAAPAWIDLELLLRTLAEVHARPLLLSMPVAGQLYDQTGVSRSTRELYYTKLRAIVQRYNFELIEFKEHDEDPAFLYRQASHLAAKGWIFYNRALDDFFHGRIPRT
jgi:D-alanine transfer protein